MATTVDLTKGAAGAAYPASDLPKVFIIENIIDFAATNRTATDILQALNVKAGTFVLLAGVEVLVVEDSTATIDLGDGSNADGYLDAADIEAAVGYFDSSQAYTASTTNANAVLEEATRLYGVMGGKFYTANDTIDVTLNGTSDTGKIRVFAVVFDCTGRG